MRAFFGKPYRWAVVYGILLVAAFTFVLLDTFVIPKEYEATAAIAVAPATAKPGAAVSSTDDAAADPSVDSESAEPPAAASTAPVIGDASYSDGNITIAIETIRAYNTTVHIADVQVADARYLRTALAGDAYGRNIKETTSAMAREHGALLAVNGDYYGFRDEGCVLRNGVLYREGAGSDALALYGDGRLAVVDEGALSDEGVLSQAGAAWQVWSFGPVLVEGGEIRVDADTEISGRSARSNPRTAIGSTGPLRYVFIVSEGRTEGNAGLSLLQLAELFAERGCETAYNLDGGGSSTMYFNGAVVNETATSKRDKDEREVSDIVYIGYE
jgi:exopolysaccharide biosynthesis protein